MEKTDLNIIKAMYLGNYLDDVELKRAEYLVFVFALYLKNNGHKLDWI